MQSVFLCGSDLHLICGTIWEAAIWFLWCLIHLRRPASGRWWCAGRGSTKKLLCESYLPTEISDWVHGCKEISGGTVQSRWPTIGSECHVVSLQIFFIADLITSRYRHYSTSGRTHKKAKGSRSSLSSLQPTAEVSASHDSAGRSSITARVDLSRLSRRRSSMPYPRYPDAPRCISW